LRALFEGYQARQLIVGFHLLLDLSEFHGLLGELVGVERIQRILVFQLRRWKLQKRGKIAGDLGVVERVRHRACTDSGSGTDRRHGLSSDANIETAALAGKAVVNLRRYVCRQRVVLHDKLCRIAAVCLLLVRRLIAQRELQSVVGGPHPAGPARDRWRRAEAGRTYRRGRRSDVT
jgi:hypothetical protein